MSKAPTDAIRLAEATERFYTMRDHDHDSLVPARTAHRWHQLETIVTTTTVQKMHGDSQGPRTMVKYDMSLLDFWSGMNLVDKHDSLEKPQA